MKWVIKLTELTGLAGLSKGENACRAFVLFVIGVVQMGLFAGLASAGVLDFSDNFDSFDEARWTEGDHRLGRSYLDPNNVSVSGRNLQIKLPKRSLGVERSSLTISMATAPTAPE